ncbi:quinoprotein dehydrogenase-associated SoxYZ-like carrier [Azohydromonas caseinilytica]|uniref:Quinoprotein dehydrogenase-associated SoxYZ-like carrier n=1 Tax=Azohydromonas caseinilytica TaxID=2728836 RepID=A0A848F799_9BURK|nr:quinoprotein dehydrogenase-associated SoxYZ-like carrier [Azohydromonas caseinilytica]NML15038.1 quinoprotein dehydrogenase-associated SoxYZ-like carrier [Azohydromonas caseinilytica]
MKRRHAMGGVLAALAAPWAVSAPAANAQKDPLNSMQWEDIRREFLGQAPVVFDERVQVSGPAFAEDPMAVPVSVSALGLRDVTQITVIVDRNPIRKVLDFYPRQALPALSFRFKLEQASPVRAAVRTADGVWHVGGTWVESSGGGCTVPGATRSDGSWARTLGQVSGALFESPLQREATRLRLRVMHPMDTGLVAGVPAFYLNRLAVLDEAGRELLLFHGHEPLSENPVLSFELPGREQASLRVRGSDNNGNRIDAAIGRRLLP